MALYNVGVKMYKRTSDKHAVIIKLAPKILADHTSQKRKKSQQNMSRIAGN